MKKILLFMLLACMAGNAQFRNSSQKTIFSIDNGKVSTLKLTGGETTIDFIVDTIYTPYVLLSDPNLRTARKINAINYKAGLTNVEKFVDVDDFEWNDQGMIFGISWLHSATDIYILPDTTKNPFSISTWRLGMEYRFDRFNNYNPVTGIEKRVSPQTFSVTANYSRYIFRFRKGYVIAPTLNATYSPYTYNKGDLTSFKKIELPATTEVISFKDPDGLYGAVDHKVSSGYLSASLPIMFDYQPRRIGNMRLPIPYVVPVPYVFTQLTSAGNPLYGAGLGLGFFAKSIFARETDGKREFLSPSFLSIGMDHVYKSDSKASKANIFLTGTFTID